METSWVTILLFPCVCRNIRGFNIDMRTAFVQSGPPASMFGFSVAQHIDQATSWLLIGAPKAQTLQEHVEKAGAVFRCRINRKQCDEIPFDKTGNSKYYDGEKQIDMERKSNQWFGATVESSGENGVIVACAPRYVYLFTSLAEWEPVGKCFVARSSSTDYKEYSPCKKGAWGFHKQGYCQAGFSASLAQDGKRLLIGAIGSWYWQGQLYSIDLLDKMQTESTNEGPGSEDNRYMGYSSAVGEFNGDNSDDFVVGVPRGDLLQGRVVMFNQNLSLISSIIGEQFGSYFGYSLAVADINSDRFDDVIVGAPMFSEFKGGSYETGRVYVFYQTEKRLFKQHRKDILEGKDDRGRFGAAIENVGDLNYDGYNDIAISAPYGGKESRGVIFIYHGSGQGIVTEVAQVIHAVDIQSNLKTFGFSLSGGWDLDGNNYPDILVGAYASDNAVFLRSRPVVQVTANLEVIPQLLDLEEKSCALLDGTQVTCIKVKTILEYDGISVPDKLSFEIDWQLDTLTNRSQRAYYLVDENTINQNMPLQLERGSPYTIKHFFYLKNNIRDKLTPVGLDMKFKLIPPSHLMHEDLDPVLDKYIPRSVRTEAQILKDCGKDNICIPDLRLTVKRISEYHVVGSKRNLEIGMKIENHRDDAFEAMLVAILPPGVTYVKVQDVKSVASVSCEVLKGDAESIVRCDLGNPLPRDSQTSLLMKFSANNVNGSDDFLNFNLVVNSSNSEAFINTNDNVIDINIPVKAAAEVVILGKSTPDQIIYNASHGKQFRERMMYNNSFIEDGPQVTHLYEVRNQGPSDIETSVLKIHWPGFDEHGEPFLQLTESPVIMSGTGVCKVSNITPTEEPKKMKSAGYQIREKRRLTRQSLHKFTCSEKWCVRIKCKLGEIEKGSNILISIKSRLWTSTLIKMGYTDAHLLTSQAKLVVTSIPYSLKMEPNNFPTAKKEVSTYVNPENLLPKPRVVEIWVIVVAASAGVLLLLLIVILLWWCGFFKRRKHKDSDYYKHMHNGEIRKPLSAEDTY